MDKTEAVNTVSVLRIIKAPPERVFRAFVEPDAKIRWEPPFGFIGKIHEWDLRVGGRYHMSFSNFSTGNSHSFGGEFIELVENEKIVVSDAFDDPILKGMMRTSVTIRPVANGTELKIEQPGLPEAIPLEFCYAGWQESLLQLAQLVEPEVPVVPTECGIDTAVDQRTERRRNRAGLPGAGNYYCPTHHARQTDTESGKSCIRNPTSFGPKRTAWIGSRRYLPDLQ